MLVADDSADIRRLLAAYLVQAGLEVETAVDGQDAVDQGLARPFDLILMDMQMPALDGVGAARALRAGGATAPIVAVTANVRASEVRRYREAGCAEVLAKPIDRDAFYDAIGRCLRGAVPALPEGVPADLQAALDVLRAEFLAGLPTQLERLERARRDRDWAAACAVAHSLKGTAGSYGFPELTEAAGLAELAILADEFTRASTICARVVAVGRRALRLA